MKILYFDTWEKTPDPITFPGCITVRVVSACSPGDQSHIRAQVSKTLLFKDIFKRSRRALKRAYRYSQAIGAKRLISKVRSNILSYQNQMLDTISAVSGVVIEAEGDNMPAVGSRVAGFRTGYPLYTDFMLLHPQQIAEVPPGISPEDAATVFYYALALETCHRIQDNKSQLQVIICGGDLPCRLLNQFLTEAGSDVELISEYSEKMIPHLKNAIKKGKMAVIGDYQWLQSLAELPITQKYFMGLNPDVLTPQEWQDIQSNWVGLPHSACKNVNIFSLLPLELPEYLNNKGLNDALMDMGKRSWKPSSFLDKYDIDEAKEEETISLKSAYSFCVNNRIQNKESVVRRKKAHIPYNKKLLRVGVAGLGLWARGNLIPFLLKDDRVRLVMGADIDPVRLQQAANLFDIPLVCSDPEELCRSDEVDAVFISTWHDSHAEIASMALNARKKVFVEKPPVVNYDQLQKLACALKDNKDAFLAIGYNRAHSALTKIIHPEILKEKGPITFSAIVREPSIPRTHYYYWPHQGTRIVGNSCHWIDYAFHLLLPRIPKDIQVISTFSEDAQDNNVIIMRYGEGSVASLTFTNRGESLINGDEYIDIKMAGTEYMIHDFKTCTRYKEGKLERIWESKADRGWENEMRDVVDGVLSGKPPRDYSDIIASANIVLEAKYSFENNGKVRLINTQVIERLK